MITRREFCFGALTVVATTLTNCREHVPVLKIPENADECVDLFRFFTDPAFALEQAKVGLGVTGEPRLMNDPGSRKLFTFDDQPGFVKTIDLQTGPDDRADAGKLTSIYIYYRDPIDVSLRRVESYLGSSKEYKSQVAGPLPTDVSSFTNLRPGQKLRDRSSYGFYPDPIAPGHLKGSFLFSCDSVYSDTKRVDMLRYERFVVAD